MFIVEVNDLKRKMASRPLAGRLWKRTLKEKRVAKNLVKRWNIVAGDMVEVISGKDRGKQGEVLRVDRKLNYVYVDGAAHEAYVH